MDCYISWLDAAIQRLQQASLELLICLILGLACRRDEKDEEKEIKCFLAKPLIFEQFGTRRERT